MVKLTMAEGDEYREGRRPSRVPRPPPPPKKWYKEPWVFYLGAGIVILLIILAATGRLSTSPLTGTEGNVTKEPTLEDQLVSYVIAQRDAGVRDTDIQQRLILSGYSEEEITRAIQLADPTVQYIKTELEKGTSRPVIVETLLKQGHTPEEISAKFALLEPQPTGLFAALQKYWYIIAIAIIVIFIIKRQSDAIAEKKEPKIYSLKECLETAEAELKERSLVFCPSKEYKNRPELKQYRYVFEEPVYPEFNHHKPTGNKQGGRRYYLIGVGYDKELVDFRITMSDTDIRPFLYGRPSSWEPSSTSEYHSIRQRSDRPLEEFRPPVSQFPYEDQYRTPSYRRPYRRSPYRGRITPGPIEGFEA